MGDSPPMRPLNNPRVIVAGTRTFANYDLLCLKLDALLSQLSDPWIISGGASGADALGEKYAVSRFLPLLRVPANWNAEGKRAGYLRNKRMAEYATHCVVFWDGTSRGSKMMIEIAEEMGLFTRVIHYIGRGKGV